MLFFNVWEGWDELSGLVVPHSTSQAVPTLLLRPLTLPGSQRQGRGAASPVSRTCLHTSDNGIHTWPESQDGRKVKQPWWAIHEGLVKSELALELVTTRCRQAALQRNQNLNEKGLERPRGGLRVQLHPESPPALTVPVPTFNPRHRRHSLCWEERTVGEQQYFVSFSDRLSVLHLAGKSFAWKKKKT